MKILPIILLLFCFTNAICQETANSIEYSNIHIINTLKHSYSLGSAKQLQQAFGKIKVVKEPDEVQDGFGYTYKYKGLTVYFHEHNWDSAMVTGTEYSVILNGITYKVGEPISKLNTAFPLSYKHREKRTKNNFTLRIDISNKRQLTDAFIFISYNNKNYITEIWVGNNDS